MKRSALVITLFFALIAFACGFGGGTAYFNVTQPANPGSTATVLFEVQDGDRPSDLGPRLQAAGLIRNATVFTYYTKYIKKFELKKGVFTLSPGFTMDKIIATLATATPIPQVSILIGPGLRILEYPMVKESDSDNAPLVRRFRNLPNFNDDNFIKIATTGKYLDGTDVSKSYWFVAPLHKDAKAALEGYLYPDTYFFNKTDDETAVINRMLDAFGTMLCPGPDDNPGAYFDVAKDCKEHMAKVGADQKTDILKVAKAKFFVTDDSETGDVEALYKALTLASMVRREASSRDNYADRVQIADIFYRRLLASQGKLATPAGDPNPGNYHCIDDDSSSWYGYDSDHKPDDGKYWKIQGAPKTTAPESPYNTYTHCTDLPPGPISSPNDAFYYAATDPNLGQITKAFFYLHDGCLNPHTYLATTFAQHVANIAKYNLKCPTGN